MKQVSSLYLFISLLAVSFSSCTLIDKPEQVPAFLVIDTVLVQTDEAAQGSTSHNITEAWVFIDDDLQGIYDLPCNVPILSMGDHLVEIRGGIKRNGVSSLRVDYPFYFNYDTTVHFAENQTVRITPAFGYFDNATIWFENFEDPGVKLQRTTQSDTGIFKTTNPDEVFEGEGSGKVLLLPGQYKAQITTNQRFRFPKGQPIFIEMDYLTNDTTIVGLVTHDGTTDIYEQHLYLLPVSKWNKVYVDLSEIRSRQAATQFDVFFEIVNRENGNPQLLLDNIKVIYPN